MDLVEGLLPIKEEDVEGVVCCLCGFHESSKDVDGLRAGPAGPEAILCGAELLV